MNVLQKKMILAKVDATLLKPCATQKEILALCEDAKKYHTATACIPPVYIESARKAFPKLKLCTVIGFPLGFQTTEAKLAEAADALKNGCDEIDMVISRGLVRDRAYDKITLEIAALKNLCGRRVLKVIIETCDLSTEEKIRLCSCVSDGGADYIKTSTGFGSAGADIADIFLLRKHLPKNVRIKAAGGIKTLDDFIAFDDAGADRIGASNFDALK